VDTEDFPSSADFKCQNLAMALCPIAVCNGDTIASSLSLAAAFFASAGCFFTGVLLWFELAHTEQENLVGSREELDTREMLGVFFNGFDGF
jgi:hypothetical protein